MFPTRSFPLDCSRTAPNKNRNKFPTFPEPRCRRNSQLRRSSSADRSSGSEASLDSRRRLVIANLHSPYFSVRHSGYSNWYSVLSIGPPCWRGGVYRVMLIGLFEKISSFNHRRHNPGHGETVRMSTCVNPHKTLVECNIYIQAHTHLGKTHANTCTHKCAFLF